MYFTKFCGDRKRKTKMRWVLGTLEMIFSLYFGNYSNCILEIPPNGGRPQGGLILHHDKTMMEIYL